jgi:hypothetical protein
VRNGFIATSKTFSAAGAQRLCHAMTKVQAMEVPPWRTGSGQRLVQRGLTGFTGLSGFFQWHCARTGIADALIPILKILLILSEKPVAGPVA